MCLILFAYKSHPDYPLVVAANRDEYYQRPTRAAHWWPEAPHLLAGQDLEGGGTWMGITRSGRFAAVTNVREGLPAPGEYRSRGILPLDFLNHQGDDSSFSTMARASNDSYRGYNLLFGSVEQLFYYTNRREDVSALTPGIYGLSNAALDDPWPKVNLGKDRLKQALSGKHLDPARLLAVLADESIAADSELPQTGVSLELERLLSATLIRGENYGTRSSSVLMIDKEGQVTLLEKDRAPNGGPVREFQFSISQ